MPDVKRGSRTDRMRHHTQAPPVAAQQVGHLRVLLVVALAFATVLSPACTTEYGARRFILGRPVLVAVPLECQPTSATSSSLALAFLDNEGAPFPGVRLVLTPSASGSITRHVVSDPRGQVVFSGLQSGTPFELRASMSGFLPLRAQFRMSTPSACSGVIRLQLAPQPTITQQLVRPPLPGPA